MYSPTRQKGNIAEDVVSNFLQDNGFTIIDRNILRKWGEIDIIASKNNKIHFVEVKSMIKSTTNDLFHVNPVGNSIFNGVNPVRNTVSNRVDHINNWTIKTISDSDPVSRETHVPHETDYLFDPIWNMTSAKQRKFSRTIRTYLAETYREDYPEFQIDIITAVMDFYTKIVYIRTVENVILEN